jgi:hypothetical protein
MPKIVDDFIGELWADRKGALVVLRAGDDVPAGVEVDPDLIAKPVKKDK